MKRQIVFFLLSFSFLAELPQVLSNVIVVPTDFSTIQGALNNANTQDTVLVQPGTYYENIVWPVVQGIKLLSAGDTTNTIINGNNYIASVIIFLSGNYYDTTTVVSGFTITNGKRGISISDASPKLNTLNITRNKRSGDNALGGGLFCTNSSPYIYNSLITFNTLEGAGNCFGAGMYCDNNSNPFLLNVNISNNKMGDNASAYLGAGIYCGDSSSLTLEDVAISSNIMGNGGIWYSGGGLYCTDYSSLILENVTISSNIMGEGGTWYHGGGIYCENNSNSILNDVIIESNLMGDGGSYYYGGGFCCKYYCNPILNNVIISSNVLGGGGACNFGGGFYCSESCNSTLYEALITSNYSGDSSYSYKGGGLYCGYYSNLTLEDVTISSNIMGNGGNRYKGGGLYCEHLSDLTFEDVTISSNIMGSGGHTNCGAGCYCFFSVDVSMINVLISSNRFGVPGSYGSARGGGVCCDYYSDIEMRNVTIANNNTIDSSEIIGSGIQCYYYSEIDLRNTILWNDNQGLEIAMGDNSVGEIMYSDIRGGWTGECNIDGDPLFISNDDFHLQLNSPCIGSGMLEGSPSTDIEGNPRPSPTFTNPDMGAYEMDQPVFISENNRNENIVRIYPNPFSNKTTLEIKNQGNIQNFTFTMYDIYGREVRRLEKIESLKTEINRNNLRNGTYLYFIKSSNETIQRGRIIIL